MEFLSGLLNVAVIVFSVSAMLSMGLGNELKEVLGPLRGIGRVSRALLANFVLVPLLTLAILHVVSLDRPLQTGLLLISTAAGAPFLIKLIETAGGNLGFSVSLLVLLLPVTVVYMPAVVPLLVPGTMVNAGAIAMPLFLTMLLPLAVGLFVRARRPGQARRLQPVIGATSTVALLILVLTTLVTYFPEIAGIFGTGAILSSLLVIGGAFAIGYVLGGADPDAREVLGLGTSQRNIAAATVVATQSFSDPRTVVIVVVSSLAGLALLFPVAWMLRKRRKT
ncbi:MAG: bile acid:sodium symporter [Nocardiopsaceae bacterium]|nr:bile acid:sodium symporter [Nocardiopsaceae bacterium]